MMLRLSEIAAILGCVPEGFTAEQGALTPAGAGIDSRKIAPGELFFCLEGEHADGHDFALDAAAAGASAVIAARDPFRAAGKKTENGLLPPLFLTDSPRKALGRLAARHRDMTAATVIGVTGTAGKTSVKEVLAHVLARRGPTARNPMNLNNGIGLPLSMLNASTRARFWVLELGISEEGDMEELGALLRPDAAVILNVGDAHLNGLGARGVAAHKALLLDFVRDGGLALISADYPDLQAQAAARAGTLAGRGVELACFSMQAAGDGAPSPQDAPALPAPFVRARFLAGSGELAGRYALSAAGRECEVSCCFQGLFGSENVAAIAAVALKMGMSLEETAQGFAGARLPGQRFHCRRRGAVTLVDDSYNANPLSCARMLHACRTMADESSLPLFLVMGEMLELGAMAGRAHEDLGRNMAAVRPEAVFWKGGQGDAVLRGLRRGGYAGAFFPVEDEQDFSRLLKASEPERGLFLVKGSRGNRLERLTDILHARMALTGETDDL
jgi:UDP-N-acetylmuramoyl-tripeptide--D-alanyl-D-alanine ligase